MHMVQQNTDLCTLFWPYFGYGAQEHRGW